MNPNPTILVVDDEVKAQILLRNLLELENYRVICAGSEPDAIAAARERPDVVLLDLMMPGMDGYEVCQRLRATPELAAVPIIILTALDDRASRLRGLESGADDFLTKPFDASELRARLRTITRLNRYRQLYEERARFESAIDFAPEGVVLAELDGTIIHGNEAFRRLFHPDSVVPENFYACLPEAVGDSLRQTVLAQEKLPAACETPFVLGREKTTIVEVTHSPIPWEGRAIVQFHLRDLTEKKVLEAQLLRSQRIELLGQMSGSIVHDLNNVLAAIGGSAAMIGFRTEDADVVRHLGNIHNGVQRGASMLRQLLMFARGSDGELAPMSPAGVVAEVTSLVRESFGRCYEVSLAAGDDLPLIEADSTQLHQIVMNLCVNARDAMPEGGRLDLAVARRTVDAAGAAAAGAGAAPGDYVVVSVRDSGTGIPPDVCARLFDPFFTTKGEGKGTGLGLATVLRLTRRHKGFVTYETDMGKGTCFFCHFPVAGASAARADQEMVA
jgi:PAS domain S-box-containing protein